MADTLVEISVDLVDNIEDLADDFDQDLAGELWDLLQRYLETGAP